MMNQVSDLPATIGDYEVLGELARDDASVVLRARQTSLDRIVALKVVRAKWAADPVDLERFLRGARAAARLDHPHIVRVFDVGRTDDLHYFAMGLVEGQSLSQRVAARGPLPPREAIELVLRVAQATAYTHGQKIVHRGLSPDCVLLEADGKPRVTGFGLARPTAPGHSLTAGGVRVDPFTPPETITGTGRPDSPAVDVYGLGGILYFALTGQPPHKAASIAELAASIVDAPVVSPRKLNSKVPRDFEAICLRCLATSPNDRFASAAQVVEALDQVVSGKGSGTGWLGRRSASPQNSAEGSTEHIIVGASSNAAATTDTNCLSDLTRPRRSRSRLVLLLIGGLLLTAVGGVVAWRLRGNANLNVAGMLQVTEPADIASTERAVHSVPPPKAIAPHSAEQAAALQAAWAKHLALPEQSENSLGMKFRLIPPGQFDMGATDADANDREAAFAKRETDRKAWATEFLISERPQHRVYISKPFYLGVHEVTNQQYAAFAREYTTSNWKAPDEAALQQEPASAITADEATAFCRWLSKLEGRTYRLPTEAEWEFAARAGTTTRYFTGDTEESLRDYANVADQSLDGTTPFEPYYHWVPWNDGFPEFAPVGTFRANPFGLHDLHGSAFEWTGDWYDEKFYARTPSWDPNGPISGTKRVGKGGSAAALMAPEYLASSARIAFLPKHELGDWGFRVVLEVPAEKWPSLTPDERLERGREWAEFLLVEEQKQQGDSAVVAEQIQVAWQQVADDLRAGESAVAQLDPSARDRVTILRKMATDRDSTLIRQLAKMERDLIASLTAENWTFNDSAATAECDRLFREAGIDINAPSIADTVAKYEARSEVERQVIKYWLTRWECYATTANRPEAARIRTLLGVLEDDPWGHQFLAARTNTDPAPLLALATAATKTLPPRVETSELLVEALIARGLATKPETVALIKAVQAKFKTRVWPNIRLAELQQPTVLQVTGLDRIRRIHEITGFLREAQNALGGENSGLTARITAIESMGTPSQVDRSVAERERFYQRQYPKVWPLIVTARKARESKQYDQAITLLREALAKQANVPQGEFELAANFVLNGQDEEAEPLLKKIAQNAADDGAAYQVLREFVRILDSVSSDTGKSPRETGDTIKSFKRVTDYFFKYRRNFSADSFTPILNGRDLASWTPMRSPTLGSHELTSGGWESKDDQLLCATSESGWLRFDQQQGDFELDLEFLIPEGKNSGILVRHSGEGELYREGGMEIQIEDDPTQTKPDQKTGSIYGRAAAKENAFRRGEWNQLTILCEGERVAVALNGNQVVDVKMNEHPSLNNLPRKGYLGIYNPHGTARGTAFRNLRLHTKPASANDR